MPSPPRPRHVIPPPPPPPQKENLVSEIEKTLTSYEESTESLSSMLSGYKMSISRGRLEGVDEVIEVRNGIRQNLGMIDKVQCEEIDGVITAELSTGKSEAKKRWVPLYWWLHASLKVNPYPTQ